MTDNTAINDFLDSLPNPDMSGSSEYRIVHEHVTNMVRDSGFNAAFGNTEQDTADQIVASLFELAKDALRVADMLQNRIDGGPTGIPTVLSAMMHLSYSNPTDPVVIEDDDFDDEGDYVSLRTIA